MSLKKEAGKGIIWVAVERFGQQILQGIIFIVLARLLTPDDFGLIGMLMIFIAVSQSFVDSGMGQALIRQKEITDEDRATVFWFNLLISLIFYLILFLAAPWIAAFFEQPQLAALTRFMGLTVIFNGLAIVQRSELTQQLIFKKQAYAQVPAMVIAGTVSVLMAFWGFGVWALAVQQVLFALSGSIFLWAMQPSSIKWIWSRESFDRLFGFGNKLLVAGLLNTIYLHIYKLVIGKYFAAATLGFYTQAKKLNDLVSHSLVGIIQKVTYPLMSKSKDDMVRLKRAYRQIIQSSSFVVFPGMLVLIILAEPLMINVLGAKWRPAAPFLQIIGLSGMLYHLHAINLNVLKVLGRSDLYLKLEVIKKVNITVAIFIGLQFGLYGLLIGQVISSYIALLINTYYTAKFLNYSIGEQLQDVLTVFFLGLPMAVFILLFQYLLPIHSVWTLVMTLSGAVMVYLISNLIYRTEVNQFVFGMVSPYLPKSVKRTLNI